MPRPLLTILTTTLLLLGARVCVAMPVASAGVPGTDVYGDDAGDRYVGTGGLILPGSFEQGTRTRLARCADCRWRLAVPCAVAPPAPGTLMPGQAPVAACTSVVRGCPRGQLLRTWFASGDAPWVDLGVACFDDGPPHTIAELGVRVRDAFAADLPPLQPTAQPASGVLAQIPVAFSTGQPGEEFSAQYELLGETVDVRAVPNWSWRFGDGGSLTTSDPGGSYPNLAVSHPYRRPGRFTVTAVTTWSGRFAIAGLGEFPVREPVRQDASTRVVVGEGRAVLAVR